MAGQISDIWLLLSHPPTVTLGKRAGDSDLLWSPERYKEQEIEIFHTDRGGQATYHGPGQLIAYPIVHLGVLGRSIPQFIEALGQAMINTLGAFGIPANWDSEKIGVWAAGGKIGYIGIHVSRLVTMHGLALNVDPDLNAYAGIIPCGEKGGLVSSMAAEAGKAPPMEEVQGRMVRELAEIFGSEHRFKDLRKLYT